MGQVFGASILRTQSDARLASLAAAGHAPAFEAIVARYERELRRHCARINPGQAEDAVQQTFLSAWTALQSGTTVRDLRGWLHRIAHHAALRTLDPAGLAVQLADDDAAAESPDATVERRLAVHGALAAVAGLPERQREALLLSAVDGESREAIARHLGVTAGAVRQLVHRARQTVRAAATAVMPAPLLVRLAGIDDGVAGGLGGLGAAGAGVALKAGAVVAVVAAIAAAPFVVRDDRADRAQAAAPPARDPSHDGRRGSGASLLAAVARLQAGTAAGAAARRTADARRGAATPTHRSGRGGRHGTATPGRSGHPASPGGTEDDAVDQPAQDDVDAAEPAEDPAVPEVSDDEPDPAAGEDDGAVAEQEDAGVPGEDDPAAEDPPPDEDPSSSDDG